MGKILKSYSNGWAGAIARSLDDVVVALPNRSDAALAFGVPVALSSDKSGVIPFDANTHTAADFVGVTVRNPSKTPETYGSNAGSYAAKDLVDVLVRGHISVVFDNYDAKAGEGAGVSKSTGNFTSGSGDTLVALPTVSVSGAPDNSGVAELLLKTRNLL